MKKYLHALYESFGQIRLYYQVIYQWVGSGYVYGWVLATLTAILMAIQFVFIMNHFTKYEMDHILSQWPKVTLSNGEMITHVKQPYMITSSDKTVIAIIDTTVEESELEKKDAAILIGKDFMLAKKQDGTFRKTDLKKFNQQTIILDKEKIRTFLNTIRYTPLILLPALIVGQWFIIIAMMIGAAVLSYVVTAYMKEEFDFETRMRIGAIAITPPLLINQLLQMTTQYTLGMWIVLILWVVHLYVMVIAARTFKERIETTI
jgi:hypothetical protein